MYLLEGEVVIEHQNMYRHNSRRISSIAEYNCSERTLLYAIQERSSGDIKSTALRISTLNPEPEHG